jgi:hypothetical protein
MAQRVRFYMTWSVYLVPGLKGAPFSKIEDFYAMARGHLVTRFENYNSELSITVREDFGSFATLDMIWDVDLDSVPGAWHNPEDHVKLARTELVKAIPSYGRKLDIDIYREADPEDIQDHAVMAAEAGAKGIQLEQDDYPCFRPEKNPDWPEANEVFLQEGVWWWCAPKDPSNPDKPTGPAVGPDPVKIYTLWDAGYRERKYARRR